MQERPDRPIALIGLMGAGKTTVAQILGERIGGSVADLDAMIEAETGLPISAIFEREGEGRFRARERELLERVLAGGVDVIACGGGIVTDARSRDLLERHCRVVWLETSPEAASERLESLEATRPMLAGGAPLERLRALLDQRRAHYEKLADLRVATDRKSPDAVADTILEALDGAA
jgi:shikimate kinase